MKQIALTLAALVAIGGPVSAATFANDSGVARAIGSTFVGLVETDRPNWPEAAYLAS